MKISKDIILNTVLVVGFIVDVFGSNYVYEKYGLLYSMAFGFVVTLSIFVTFWVTTDVGGER